MDFKVLPNPPKIDNLPILVNQGAATQHFVLKGERLELDAAGWRRRAPFSTSARRAQIRRNGA